MLARVIKLKSCEVSETESGASHVLARHSFTGHCPSPTLPPFYLLFWDKISLNYLEWPWTHSVAQTELELEILLSWLRVAMITGLATRPGCKVNVSISNCCCSLACFSWKFLLNHALYSQGLQKMKGWRSVEWGQKYCLHCSVYCTVAVQSW